MALKNPGLVRVGMVMQDNDPRYEGRRVMIESITEDATHGKSAVWKSGARSYKVNFKRLHDDGKPRHKGWSLIG